MVAFGSDEWFQEYKDRINRSEAYREAAATWEGGVAFVFDAEPDRNWPETMHAILDLWHGECRDARQVEPAEVDAAPFLISAPYSRWKQVIRGELDPIKGMMQGKLKLRGDLSTIVRYVKASNELVNLASSVPTDFPDEA
jgi:putative sterol carrier protein